jgi:polyphosphate kinase 2 (PPK2 family)
MAKSSKADKHGKKEKQPSDDDGPSRMKRKQYERELRELQVELVHLQTWVKQTGAKICVVFEGRDAAGKGGVAGSTRSVTCSASSLTSSFPASGSTSRRVRRSRAPTASLTTAGCSSHSGTDLAMP